MIRKRINKKNLAVSLFSAFFVIFFLTLYIWHQAESIKIGYETKDLEDKIDLLNGEIEKLETQKADFLSLDRVEQVAREELGMVEPDPQQIIYDRTFDVVKNRQP